MTGLRLRKQIEEHEQNMSPRLRSAIAHLVVSNDSEPKEKGGHSHDQPNESIHYSIK
ncbi:hypothetical protein BH10ACI4_BH10ACI4_23060 [soil metagenome]